MIHTIVVSVVAGCSLLGTTLVAAQCPPNLHAEEMVSCIVTEGSGAIYMPASEAVEVQAKAVPAAIPQIERAALDINMAASQFGYE